MDDLDPTVAERVLGEYPELLDHWRQEMSRLDRDAHYRDSGMQRMHDPLYLTEVVRQHRWLTEESGNRPDNKLARRCEEIVAAFPPVRDERAGHLTNPWFRARVEPYHIAKLYDPEYLQRWVDARRRAADPFSEPSLRLQRFLDVVQAGGVLTEADIESGEVIDQWKVDPQPGDRPLN